MATGQVFTLTAEQCAFGYRDSVFKHGAPVTPIEREGVQPLGLAGRAVITHVRFRLPRPWKPELGYLDLERRRAEAGIESPRHKKFSIGCVKSAVRSCLTLRCWETPGVSSRTPR